MKIIKDKQIIEDNWTHIADDAELTNGNITVSLSRWNHEDLNNHQGKVGIRLLPADKVEDITDELNKIPLIVLEFPIFTDGRSFSHARLLRSRFNYKGEIRAIGSYMPDQVFYLSRVGVNAFQLEKPEELAVALSTMNDFTVKYQQSTN
ncbi:MAG: DUF934 domain-containing protein [Methylococcales bacterium]|nr:DUF934 domain-containing protein [Methylococcales bacterium]